MKRLNIKFEGNDLLSQTTPAFIQLKAGVNYIARKESVVKKSHTIKE